MARIDKVVPGATAHRAPLAAAWAGQANPIGVGLNAMGRLVPGAGNTGIIGIFCKPDEAAAGDTVDYLTDGAELVEFAGAAGTRYTCDNVTGVISNAAPAAGRTTIGHTIEASRLVVKISEAGE